MTRRLYHEDAYLRRFDADVIAHATYKGQPAVVLDQTAFYPEAGGQLGDRGRLGDLEVRDTQELDDGTIVHLVAGDLPPVGARITGELDWARRRQHMA
ncbi:MAG TPA: alanine--tRNA ligase-related protein, partial [Kofleriaceae bacterium]